MGKDLKGKELGVGISQRSDGFYVGRFTTKHGHVTKTLKGENITTDVRLRQPSLC